MLQTLISLLQHEWDTGRVAWHVNGEQDRYDNNHITDVGLTNPSMADNSVYIGLYPTASSMSEQQYKMLLTGTDKQLNESDIDKLFGYAAHKYNLVHKLPPNHPYKNNVPTM